MREIVLDTETTGLNPAAGHRVVEIGCVELWNFVPTGSTWHHYVNPQRDMPAEAEAVHGLSAEFLADFPGFAEIAAEFLEFIGEDRLVIHNAGFDLGFLNAELANSGYPLLPAGRALDTVALARQKFPGAPANLDDLCRRFDIDNSARELHGALLDASLLAEVYLELQGGRQTMMDLAMTDPAAAADPVGDEPPASGNRVRPSRVHRPTSDEIAAHEAFMAKLENPMWVSLGLCGRDSESASSPS